ncbi:conserved hypothetical protein [Paecilomyces variotii No. 5]|uniref:Calcium uniporter protein n=1 Tax=Byssochlamys spectabilis (strain No. 5 / NBRC 109023) TaxID=1356009 RepID=V5FM63_BYSSN|nr:conserved hypothetical protein [Paecilomyces variotii No. 5]
MSFVPGRVAAPSLRCASSLVTKTWRPAATTTVPFAKSISTYCARPTSRPIEAAPWIWNRPQSLALGGVYLLHVRRYGSDSENRDRPGDSEEYLRTIEEVKKKQRETPWQREGSSESPVRKERSATAMTKGKLLTTPSRLLKLILPVTTRDHNDDRKDIEPLALLVHPQQPLSYLERLIQAEIPAVKTADGKEKPPSISFMAMEIEDDTIRPRPAKDQKEVERRKEEEQEQTRQRKKGGPIEEPHRYLERPDPKENGQTQRFVRWSASTEVGDFIRDAARAKEFIVVIEESPLGEIPVAVPSFEDRTYYLRMRLRKVSKQLKDMAVIKEECDALAHRGAQRVAMGGFGVLVFWWYLVYRLTFETDLGWDTMEPVTYLVSLSTLMGGYLWFLYHNREVSYRSALDFTISKRQQRLYQMKGVDLHRWDSLIDEANSLRKEIKTIAAEYDVDWDERKDEGDERVTKALKQERKQKNGKSRDSKSDEDEEDE